MNTKQTLKRMLRDLIPMIEGNYILIDGGMLGLTRDADLIEYDNDLDILLLDGATIKLPNNTIYATQEYYMDTKFYDKTLPPIKVNNWKEYLSYFRMEVPGLSRKQLFQQASYTYAQELIIPKFSSPYIDIYTAKIIDGIYTIPYWPEEWFRIDEALKPVINTDLGFEVKLPSNTFEVCERIYGKTWTTPIQCKYK